MLGWAVGPPEDICEKERKPPAKPIKPEFPNYNPKSCQSKLTWKCSQQLQQQLFHIKVPANISAEHVEILNVYSTKDLPAEEFVRGDEFKKRPFQHDEALAAAIKEFQTPNDDAFRQVLRLKFPPGVQRPKLSRSHNFFKALEELTHFWDNSKDNYYEIPDTSDLIAATDIRPPPGQNVEMPDTKHGNAPVEANRERQDQVEDTTTAKAGSGILAESICNSEQQEPKVEPTIKMKEVYKGRRSGNGESVPEHYLENCVKALIETCTWEFRATVVKPYMRTRLNVRNVLMPVNHTFDVGSVPQDRVRARKGHIEGPIMAVHCRTTTKFREEGQQEMLPSQAEILDFYGELGTLLFIAQKRARTGKKEVIPGKKTWWGEGRRWGGGKGGHMPHESDEEPWQNAATKKKTEEEKEAEMELADEEQKETEHDETRKKGREKKKRTKRGTDRFTMMMDRYKDLELGHALWDDHILYTQMGKQDSSFDDVFVVSALHHHICFLQLRVHKNYLHWLETGKAASPKQVVAEPTTTAAAAGRPQLHENMLYVFRSRWYDMFDVEQRVEALTALWRITSWIYRPEKRRERDGEDEEKTVLVVRDSKRLKQGQDGGDGEGEMVMDGGDVMQVDRKDEQKQAQVDNSTAGGEKMDTS